MTMNPKVKINAVTVMSLSWALTQPPSVFFSCATARPDLPFHRCGTSVLEKEIMDGSSAEIMKLERIMVTRNKMALGRADSVVVAQEKSLV